VPLALDRAAADGSHTIIVHPFFLNSGMHVTESIPAMLEDAQARHHGAEFIYAGPLGISEGIVQTAIARINEARDSNKSKMQQQGPDPVSG
jgi:sirohydrochlorin ferrochelatase